MIENNINNDVIKIKHNKIYDVAIIGAGVIGTACARELSKYELDVIVLEKNLEVGEGTTKANSAIVHGGYDCIPGTLKAMLNVKGASMMEKLSLDLDFPYEKTGSLVIAFNEKQEKELEVLLERGIENGVKDLKIISGDEARKMEENLSPSVTKALYCSESGIVCPFSITYAFIENAMENGVSLKTDFKVSSIIKKDDLYYISNEEETIVSKCVVNASGIHSGQIASLVNDKDYFITPRKGEYRLLDKSEGKTVKHVIFQTPSELGKGVLVTPTVHGNLLIGPNSIEVDGDDDLKTTKEGLDYIDNLAKKSVPSINFGKTIRVFSGLRATPNTGDFMIYESKNNKGFFHVGGIESPGLASSPAIGEYLKDLILNSGILKTKRKAFPIEDRSGFLGYKRLPEELKKEIIKDNPAYGRIVCRCEKITEGEIVEAIRRIPGAVTIDGIKRRVRPGMGRCQGSFCTPKVIEILSRELKIKPEEVLKDSKGSNIILGYTKGK